MPWCLTTVSMKSWAKSGAEQVVTAGWKWASLVSLSTTTKMAVKPLGVLGRSVIRSKLTDCQGSSGMGRQWLKQPTRCLSGGFAPLATVTGFDVEGHISGQSMPMKGPLQQLLSLFLAKMASQNRVMSLKKQGLPELRAVRDLDPVSGGIYKVGISEDNGWSGLQLGRGKGWVLLVSCSKGLGCGGGQGRQSGQLKMIWPSGEGISSIAFASDVLNSDVERLEELHPPGLPGRFDLSLSEQEHESSVISKEDHFSALQVAAPVDGCIDHCKGLFVVGRVVSLCCIELPAFISKDNSAMALILAEFTPKGKVRGISPDIEGVIRIRGRQLENRSCSEAIFEGLECCLASRSPEKRGVLSSQLSKR